MIELDEWILMVNMDDHEAQVGSIERVMVDSGAAVSVCPLGYAPEIPVASQQPKKCDENRVWSTDRARQKMVEFEDADGGLVKVNFEVADVMRPLVAVGELQKRGMTVVLGPPRKLRDSRPRDKTTRRQPGIGALKRCLLDASVERRKWHEYSGSC